MKLAVDAGSASPENAAWTLVQLGHLYFHSGRLDQAAREYERALERFPRYIHAEAALARVEAARGNYDRAAGLYRAAVDTNPLPEFAVGLGDALAARGREAEANEAYELVGVIQRLLEGNGVRTEFETALFDLDHDRDVGGALARVERAYEDRKSVDAEDVLAWAYYKNSRCREAKEHSVLALRLGTKDALKLFHRGMIERCLGNEKAGGSFLARALETNPYFSLLYAPVAKEILR
jgi:tetratricopeptide (TPR) repeat protein